MRVSKHFRLGREQPSLDFVDVDITNDLKVFVDPRALQLLPSPWGSECVSLVQNFFQTVLRHIHAGRNGQARRLLAQLREPNETHLGMSRRKAQGRGMGTELAKDVWDALSKSEAASSGLLEDLEDTILMVEGVGPDIVSDITTNIIREPLIHYTQDVCRAYGIQTGEVESGPLWDPKARDWYSEYVQLPTARDRKLLLVPKAIVRRRLEYAADEYFRHYILEALIDRELAANSSLVKLLKDGRQRVYKKDLIEKYGSGKTMIVRETLRSPEILAKYRFDKRVPHPPMSHLALSNETNTDPPKWDELLKAVLDTPPGPDHATGYHRNVEALLSALFYPALMNPALEEKINDGRKRVDIVYTNVAESGFFAWLAQHHPAAHVMVECKNYSRDVGNPELDQMVGRFSPSRGRFGMIMSRSFEDKELFIARCRDSAQAAQGFIVPLDDNDLVTLVDEVKAGRERPLFGLLKERFDRLVM